MPLTRFSQSLLLALFAATSAPAAERVPWTTSHVHGSPEKPLPYRVERVFPKATFKEPLEAATIPGTRRLLVVQQDGHLFSIEKQDDQPELFADLLKFNPEVKECYSVAFHPRFAENRFVFVWINLDTSKGQSREDRSRIVRFKVTEENPPRLDIASGELIFSWLVGGHNGGSCRFGPDGMLYISTGDGASVEPPDEHSTGQDISDVLASVLRIDVDHPAAGKAYGIPKDNPFLTTPNARGEVWAYGFRNPWRLTFDPKSGELYAGDVGWELWEMIYRVQRAGNYGWSITEGSKQEVRPDRLRGPTPILPALVAHGHKEAASITGGEFYYGKKLPELKGAYLYGDWQMGTFWALWAKGDEVHKLIKLCHTPLLPAGFGIAPDGEVIICDQGGGGLWQFATNVQTAQAPKFPRKLSETGLFSDLAKDAPAPGVYQYQVNATRWADHATAERWIAIPGKANMSVAEKGLGVIPPGRWVFPDDTVLAKTYSLELERGNPKTRRRVETQILHFDGLLWGTYTYRWNAAQTDAELVGADGDETVFEVKDPAAPGGTLQQKWRFFSRTECARCHNFRTNYAPGFAPMQLDHTTPAGDSQLAAFINLGIAPAKRREKDPILPDPYGAKDTLAMRARSYLNSNCGVCHRPHGGGSVRAFMNIETHWEYTHLIGNKAVLGDLGLPDARVIAPGDPARSVLLYRMATSGHGHMPYLGGALIDDRGVLVIRDWIAAMAPGDKGPSAEARKQRDAEQSALAKLKTGDTAQLEPLLASASGALDVALSITDGSLTGELRAQAIAKGNAIPDPMRRDLFERFLPASQRRAVLGNDFKPQTVLALKGNAAKGKVLFTICAACHRANGEGTDFGPDLSQIAKKWKRPELLEQILAPSKIIEPQWQLTTISLTTGDAKAGFVSAHTAAEVTLKMPGGTTEKIPAAQIAKTTTERVSMMPEGLLQSLTAAEAADLLEFLDSLK